MTQIIEAFFTALANIGKKHGPWAVMFMLLAAWVLWSSWNENEKRKIIEVQKQHKIDSLQTALTNARIEAAQYRTNQQNSKELK